MTRMPTSRRISSDTYEVRSEVSSSETMTPDELGHNEAESGQLRDVAPPGVGRREKQPSSLTNRGRDRESERDRAYNQSGAGSRTPPSEYQLAPMAPAAAFERFEGEATDSISRTSTPDQTRHTS